MLHLDAALCSDDQHCWCCKIHTVQMFDFAATDFSLELKMGIFPSAASPIVHLFVLAFYNRTISLPYTHKKASSVLLEMLRLTVCLCHKFFTESAKLQQMSQCYCHAQYIINGSQREPLFVVCHARLLTKQIKSY